MSLCYREVSRAKAAQKRTGRGQERRALMEIIMSSFFRVRTAQTSRAHHNLGFLATNLGPQNHGHKDLDANVPYQFASPVSMKALTYQRTAATSASAAVPVRTSAARLDSINPIGAPDASFRDVPGALARESPAPSRWRVTSS